jgi:hypothetical protein
MHNGKQVSKILVNTKDYCARLNSSLAAYCNAAEPREFHREASAIAGLPDSRALCLQGGELGIASDSPAMT